MATEVRDNEKNGVKASKSTSLTTGKTYWNSEKKRKRETGNTVQTSSHYHSS